jgi:uncharacterized protein with von Willebrand factor type A (vWA) domain
VSVQQDELFIKAGLAKSAFTMRIYEQLPWSYYMPYVTETQKLTRSLAHVLPKIYQAHDAFLAFYKPYDLVHTSLKKTNKAAPVWREIVAEAVKSDKFYDTSKFTAGSTELAILAAYQFLRSLFFRFKTFTNARNAVDKFEEVQQRVKADLKDASPQPKQVQQALGAWWEAMARTAEDAVGDALYAAKEFKEAREEAESALATLPAGGPGGLGFAKEALSALRFLQSPDDFRKRVRLLKYARVFTSRFSATLPTSFTHEQVASPAGGVWGVGRMNSHSKFSDILPSELALLATSNPVARALFAVKLASQQLATYQHATAVLPVLFVDKSGSMAKDFEQDIPKISVAAGLAFAMHRKFSTPVYLFDTELTAVKPKDIIHTLLTIEADGGTDIDPVLEEIIKLGKPDYIYIIISDGITSADDSVLEAFKHSGLASRTKLVLIPPAREDYNWVQLLKQYNNVQYARDVALFEKAVKAALR